MSVGGSRRHYTEYSWLLLLKCKSVSHLGRAVHICNPIILEAEAGAGLGVQGQYGLRNEFQTSLGYKAGLSPIKPKAQCLSAYTIKDPSLAWGRKSQDWSSWAGKDLNNGFLQAPRWSWRSSRGCLVILESCGSKSRCKCVWGG